MNQSAIAITWIAMIAKNIRRNDRFFVLCRNAGCATAAAGLPPNSDSKWSVASGVRRPPRIAFHLSSPYTTNVTQLIASKNARISDVKYVPPAVNNTNPIMMPSVCFFISCVSKNLFQCDARSFTFYQTGRLVFESAKQDSPILLHQKGSDRRECQTRSAG